MDDTASGGLKATHSFSAGSATRAVSRLAVLLRWLRRRRRAAHRRAEARRARPHLFDGLGVEMDRHRTHAWLTPLAMTQRGYRR